MGSVSVTCLYLLALAATAVSQAQTQIQDGPQLVQALATALNSPSSQTLLLSASVSLRTSAANWSASSGAYSGSGTVTLQPGPGSNKTTFLDLGMRSGLVQRLNGPRIALSNLSLYNLCSQPRLWDANTSVFLAVAALTWLLGPETGVVSRSSSNTVLYVPQREVDMWTYLSAITSAPFAAVAPLQGAYSQGNWSFQPRVLEVQPNSITFSSLTSTVSQDSMLQLVAQPSTNATAAAAGLPFPVYPPQYCNGTRIPPELLTTPDLSTFPLWVAPTSEALQSSLSVAGQYTSNKAASDPPPVILLLGDTILGSDQTQYAAVTLRAECILHGPFDSDTTRQRLILFSLGRQANAIQLALRGRLYMNNMIITQLVSQALGNAALDPGSSAFQTALPLWGVNMVSRQVPQVFLANVNLELPTSDYAALLSAAIRGPRWQSGSSSTRPIMMGIQVFQPAPGQTFSLSTTGIRLNIYVGWGVNATNLTLVPAVPLPANYTLPGVEPPPAMPPSPIMSPSADPTPLAVGVGVGVGGGVLLAVLVTMLMLAVHRRRAMQREAAAAAAKKSASRPNGSTGSGSTSSNSRDSRGPRPPAMGLVPGKGTVAENHINVAALHAAVKARQTSSSMETGPVSKGSNGQAEAAKDPRRAVQLAVGAIGKADADKLTLLGVLGRGTWGTVYRAQWRNLDVAVKTVLFSNRAESRGSLPHERAIMEAAVCTSVAHRNVVATYHYDIKPVQAVESADGLHVAIAGTHGNRLLTTEWKLYLVQEWCNTSIGDALRSSLLHHKATGQPLLDLLLSLSIDTCVGLQYLHDKNIIHGDLKPENVLLKMDTSAAIGVVAKITDFGLSTTLGPQATHVSNYNSGTPFYVAPEVVSEGRATKASDIYSMGVMLWELYCCSTPWTRAKDGNYCMNPRFRRFPPNTPRPFAHMVERCMQRDPKTRPTLTDMIAELTCMHQAWLDGWDGLEPGVSSTNGIQPPLQAQPQSGQQCPLTQTAQAAGAQATVDQPQAGLVQQPLAPTHSDPVPDPYQASGQPVTHMGAAKEVPPAVTANIHPMGDGPQQAALSDGAACDSPHGAAGQPIEQHTMSTLGSTTLVGRRTRPDAAPEIQHFACAVASKGPGSLPASKLASQPAGQEQPTSRAGKEAASTAVPQSATNASNGVANTKESIASHLSGM